jgi:ribonuclease E
VETPRVETPRAEARPEGRDESRDQSRGESRGGRGERGRGGRGGRGRDRSDERRPDHREPRREERQPEPPAPLSSGGDDVEDELAVDRPEGQHAEAPREGDGGEPTRRRRRRRRRGGRGRDRDRPREGAPGETPLGADSQPPIDDEFGRARLEFDEPGDFGESRSEADAEFRSVESGEPSAEGGDRPKMERDENGEPRRRRRRRRGGRGGRDRETTDARPAAETSEHHDDDDVLDVDEESITRERIRAEGLVDDLDDEPHGEGGDEGHLAHRGIPTWEEAVGMIINVNLEARAKHPHSSGGQHHRGGRGRGRGGRDRR